MIDYSQRFDEFGNDMSPEALMKSCEDNLNRVERQIDEMHNELSVLKKFKVTEQIQSIEDAIKTLNKEKSESLLQWRLLRALLYVESKTDFEVKEYNRNIKDYTNNSTGK